MLDKILETELDLFHRWWNGLGTAPELVEQHLEQFWNEKVVPKGL